MKKEIHSVKRFRGSNLGIIRLNNLAYEGKITITIEGEELKPIGFDTYGHPIISEESFTYYKAMKSIRERQGDNLNVFVEYQSCPFVIRNDCFNSLEAIKKAISCESPVEGLKNLKKILIFRKQAKFSGKELKSFILYGRYLLYLDGHIYMCTYDENKEDLPEVFDASEVTNLKIYEEVHIPGHDDVCAICGKHFDLNDIKMFSVMEDENCRKVHSACLSRYLETVNYQKASKIIDAVYDDVPPSEIVREHEKVWYLYHTKQGRIQIRFKKKVIEIKWCGNFKPFNFEKVFAEEDVTKRREDDAKLIHAWSSEDAIRYILMAKKA